MDNEADLGVRTITEISGQTLGLKRKKLLEENFDIEVTQTSRGTGNNLTYSREIQNIKFPSAILINYGGG